MSTLWVHSSLSVGIFLIELKNKINNRHLLQNWIKGPLLGRGSFGMVYKGTLTDGTEAAVWMFLIIKDEKPSQQLVTINNSG